MFNNSYETENYVIAGARGWDYSITSDRKIIEREIGRLKLSLEDARCKSFNKEIIVCMHYPPISRNYINNEFEQRIINLLKEYNVKKCLYGHLHGTAHMQAMIGNIENIHFELVSADYTDFKLVKVAD